MTAQPVVPAAPPAVPAAGAGSGTAGLVSGEAVELDVRVARVGSRVLALLVDILVQVCLLLVLLTALAFSAAVTMPNADEALVNAGITISTILVLVGYPVLAETFFGGRTIGKMTLGLRVVRDDGGPIRLRHALTRSLVGVAVEWPGLVLPLVTWMASLATMLASPRSKRLGDLAAGTIVIHERTPAAWGWVPGMPPVLAGWATTLDLTAMDDELALAVRHFLARGHGLVEPERSRLGQALAAEVAASTTPPPPPGVPGWAYLAAVLAERHRRAAHRLARARAVTATLWPALHPATPPRPGLALAAAPPAPASKPTWGPAASPPATHPMPVTGSPPVGGRPLAGGPAAPAPPGAHAVGSGFAQDPHWHAHGWPTPPWLAPTAPEPPEPDWTGMRPPPVASVLRPASPNGEAPPDRAARGEPGQPNSERPQ